MNLMMQLHWAGQFDSRQIESGTTEGHLEAQQPSQRCQRGHGRVHGLQGVSRRRQPHKIAAIVAADRAQLSERRQTGDCFQVLISQLQSTNEVDQVSGRRNMLLEWRV